MNFALEPNLPEAYVLPPQSQQRKVMKVAKKNAKNMLLIKKQLGTGFDFFAARQLSSCTHASGKAARAAKAAKAKAAGKAPQRRRSKALEASSLV